MMIDPMVLHHADEGFVLDDKWSLELKYDGVRAIVDTTGKEQVIYTRKGVDITFQFPDIVLPEGHIFDGEIIGVTGGWLYHKLNYVQRRMGITTKHKVLERMRKYPVKFVAFDFLDDLKLDYETRIGNFWSLPLTENWDIAPSYPAHHIDKMWDFTKEHHLEGLVAKRYDSKYLQGVRTYNWRKIKHDKPAYRH